MTAKLNEIFEASITFPDPDMNYRLSKLVGLDEQKDKLSKILGLLVNPEGVKKWASQNHPGADFILNAVLRRPPLVVLAGDVGSGKTELASTIADVVARTEQIEITLLPLSLSSRGSGMVGEMTKLIQDAFDYTVTEAKKRGSSNSKASGAVILLVDEADALAQSRENNQMHHEDKAGVNAFIRGIDRLGNGKLPAAVIMCTNRLSALDPAIRRRAAELLTFERPNDEQRNEVLSPALSSLGFSAEDIKAMVKATGKKNGTSYGFTYSDLIQRLLPAIVLDAYPDKKVTAKRSLEIAQSIHPTPPFNDK